MDRSPLVPNVDDANALPRDMVPDRLNVTALQTENPVDAARFQKAGDPSRAGLFVDVQILRLVRGLFH
jgi:hypothetical protein